MSKAELLQSWLTAKANLNLWKKHEAAIRAQLLTMFDDTEIESGTQNIETDIGKLTISRTLNYSLDNKEQATQKVAQSLSIENQIRLFSWTPKLDQKEYKMVAQLADMETARGEVEGENQILLRKIQEVLTIKQNATQVKVVQNEPAQ